MYITDLDTSMFFSIYGEPVATATIHARGYDEVHQLQDAVNPPEGWWVPQFSLVPELTFTFEIKKVIFNNPATIVYWKDGTKTVVKCDKDDTFDKEKGIALCFMKKALGNKGNYYNTIKKYIRKEKKNGENKES